MKLPLIGRKLFPHRQINRPLVIRGKRLGFQSLLPSNNSWLRIKRPADAHLPSSHKQENELRKSIFVLSAWVLLMLAGTACCAQQLPTSTNPPALNTPIETATVDLPNIAPGLVGAYYISSDESSITFKGLAGVADGTILRTQLYEDGKILEWWPADMDIRVSGREWMISVPSEPGRFASGPEYTLEIWQKDNPEIRGKYTFDFVGPPKATPFWVDWLRSVGNFFRNLFR